MRRNSCQRIAASLHRMSLAVDRSISATERAQKESAKFWVLAWARVAQLGGSNAAK